MYIFSYLKNVSYEPLNDALSSRVCPQINLSVALVATRTSYFRSTISGNVPETELRFQFAHVQTDLARQIILIQTQRPE